MASIRIKVKMVSSATHKCGTKTGYFVTTTKNPRTTTGKLKFMRYDPIVRKHVEFNEQKVK